jgi:HEAT repeat protein
MGHLTVSVLAPLAAASVLLLTSSLACLVALRARRARSEARAQERRGLLLDALARADRPALHAICATACTHGELREDIRVVAARWLPPSQRRLLVEMTHESGLAGSLRGLLSSLDGITRGRAAHLIGVLGLADTARELEPLLGDRDPDVRLAAAGAIAELDTREGARALIRALGAGAIEPDRLLEQLTRPSAIPELVHAFSMPECVAIRGLIAEALGLSRSLEGVSALASLVRVGGEEERLRACRALGRIGRPEVVPLLVEALADDAWRVRSQAARGLTRLAGSSCVPELERALSDGAWWVRANAAEALRFAGPAGLAALQRATTSDDRFAAERAREALALVSADDEASSEPLELAA